jgi:hypothetical protein
MLVSEMRQTLQVPVSGVTSSERHQDLQGPTSTAAGLCEAIPLNGIGHGMVHSTISPWCESLAG